SHGGHKFFLQPSWETIQMTQPINRMNRLFKRTSVAAGLLAAALGMLAFAPPAAAADNGAPKWKVWTYNPSNRAFKGGVPASVSSGIATFAFPATPDTALLVTDHGSYKGTLLGDLTGKTISATVSDSGGPFTYYGQGTPQNPCGTPANV